MSIKSLQERPHAVSVHRSVRPSVTDFIAQDEWPPNSPDLNSLGYHVWGAMLQAFHKLHSEPKTIAELINVFCSRSGMT